MATSFWILGAESVSPRTFSISPYSAAIFGGSMGLSSPICVLTISHPKSVKMPYGPTFGVLFFARIETIVTAIQNNDLIVSAPMVRLSNDPPPIT